ncbi:hypothetical protein A6R70_23800 [Agrobacterium rubi]|nr:hypothetical protein [Agrobacterium rubi]
MEYPEIADIGLSPQEHYLRCGQFEGRHPKFDEQWYLEQYPDVLNSGIDALKHYVRYGRDEYRHPAFHAGWYALEYPDVALSKVDPKAHYRQIGKMEGRSPSFNKYWYTKRYQDVVDAGFDVYYHYLINGRGEGRYPAFCEQWYVTEYPDALALDMPPRQHYFAYGKERNYQPAPKKSDIVNRARLTNFPAAVDTKYSPRENFSGKITNVKALAFYLPQFHETEENNKWWGEGFTEWTNTRKAESRFPGHYQPRVPHEDIGYYDLTDADTIRNQAKLAKEHGIFGFCFYHYWFSGKKLLNKPVDLLLDNKDIDTNFCLCWANENWTRTWDGLDNEVLVSQNYSDEDPVRFIEDIEKYLVDSRYIKIDGEPVILVYKPSIIPNVGEVFAIWRQFWLLKYGTNLKIWCVRTDTTDHQYAQLDAEFDAVVEFPPHVVPHSRHPSKYKMTQSFGNLDCEGHFYDYQKMVDDIVSGNDYSPMPSKPFYRGVMFAWDNSARRDSGQSIWYGFSIEKYYRWLRHIMSYTETTFSPDRRFVFINAWNEWAEGTYLEPDERTGYTNLNVTSRALFKMPFQSGPLPLNAINQTSLTKIPPRIAIHFHIYHVDLVKECISYILASELKCDVIFTTDTETKRSQIVARTHVMDGYNVRTIVTENKGRDVGPMLFSIGRDLLEYDIIGHFHTKRSHTVEWGDDWRKFLLDNLLPHSSQSLAIINTLWNETDIGIVSAPPYPLIESHVNWGGLEDRIQEILIELGCDQILPSSPRFPVGNMFWAKVEAIRPLLEKEWTSEDFETENNQVSGTLAHCMERIWPYVASKRGFRYEVTCSSSKAVLQPSPPRTRLCLFVHYNSTGSIDGADLHLLQGLRNVSTSVIFISNSPLDGEAENIIADYCDRVIKRSNRGFDFSAWRKGIEEIGWNTLTQFDEVVFVNNSCWGPVFPLPEVFTHMGQKNVDFWGLTSFPRLQQSERPEAKFSKDGTIPHHLQSYFMVFNKKVVKSPQFYRFWSSVEEKTDMEDVVFSYETGISSQLSRAGFTFASYVPESELLQLENGDPRFNHPYNRPDQIVLLKGPLIKKRSREYDREAFERAKIIIQSLGYYPVHLLRK